MSAAGRPAMTAMAMSTTIENARGLGQPKTESRMASRRAASGAGSMRTTAAKAANLREVESAPSGVADAVLTGTIHSINRWIAMGTTTPVTRSHR